MSNDNFLTTAEAARVLCVSSQTILDWVRSGKLKGFHAGRKWRFKYADVERAAMGSK